MFKNLRDLLKRHNIVLKQLAAEMNVSEQSVHWYLKQQDKNTIETIKKISVATGIHISEFFDNKNEKEITCPHCGEKICIEIK